MEGLIYFSKDASYWPTLTVIFSLHAAVLRKGLFFPKGSSYLVLFIGDKLNSSRLFEKAWPIHLYPII